MPRRSTLHPRQTTLHPCQTTDPTREQLAQLRLPDLDPLQRLDAVASPTDMNRVSGDVARDRIATQAGQPLAQGLVPMYRVRLSRVDTLVWRGGGEPKIRGPQDVATLLRPYLEGADREYLVCLLLDTRNGVIGSSVVSVGDLSSAIVHPREVFKVAIVANACGIICVHNHPSGDTTPSSGDVAVSRRLQSAGELIGIALLDHIIVDNRCQGWCSLKSRGAF